MEREESRIYSPLHPNLETPLSFSGQGDGDGGNMIASAVLLPFFVCLFVLLHSTKMTVKWEAVAAK